MLQLCTSFGSDKFLLGFRGFCSTQKSSAGKCELFEDEGRLFLEVDFYPKEHIQSS